MIPHTQLTIPGWDWPEPKVSKETLDEIDMATQVTLADYQLLKVIDAMQEAEFQLSEALAYTVQMPLDKADAAFAAADDLMNGVNWLTSIMVVRA